MPIVFRVYLSRRGMPYLNIVDASQAYIHQFQNLKRERD